MSLDSDFAEMAALLGSSPKVIWLRCGNQPTSAIERLLRGHSGTIAAFQLEATGALRSALIEGEQSGTSTSFDFEGFVARKRSKETRDL